jgi:anion-transporting  ArsA/GET3 family ATPase
VASPLDALLARRLLIVTGKGGVGKTSVASALGCVAARRGLDTVVVEVTDPPVIPDLLRAGERRAGREPSEIAPHLFWLQIDPLDTLSEYLELQLPARRLVRRAIHGSAFRRLLEAAPGWRELITLGKLWYLETRVEDGAPRWDLLIVDAPATGHGLSFLSVPGVVTDTVRLGPLRRHTEWVQALLRDPDRTRVLPVTLPEELPIKETLELRERVRALGLSLGPLIANGVEADPALAQPERVLAALRTVSETADDAAAPLPDVSVLREVLEHAVRRAALQRGFLEQLREQYGEPAYELPFFPEGLDVGRLADALEAALA